jgi:hypothetical protein
MRRELALSFWMKPKRSGRFCPVAIPSNRSITGAVTTTAAFQSSCPATGRPNRRSPKYPLVTYVTDGIASAMAQAKAGAGDGNVLVHGAYTAQTALAAGVLDELQIHQVPVLFGGGRRLFELLPARVELEIVRVIDTPAATHIRYRIVS